ncbi:MAG: hypothetical protein FJ398_25270 [Verrucomicrobia bacterium]|nr:hypothetical protein [Verrucomicrobiota bacterium]
MNRGDRREEIFHDDRDRELFVATLAEACAKADWQVQAYCLMENHFHLVMEMPKGNLVAGMKWFHRHLHGTVQPAAQTLRAPVQRPLQGVSGGRQQSRLFADGVRIRASESGACLCRTADRQAKLLCPEEPLRAYRWSSYPAYLERPGRRPAWLRACLPAGRWSGCWGRWGFRRTARPGASSSSG